MAASLKLWRSAWGLGGLRAAPGQTLSRVRAAGFDGLECSLRDLGETQDERASLVAAARDEGLALGLAAYSSWLDYEGPADEQLGKSSDEHLAALTRELEQARRLALSPVLVWRRSLPSVQPPDPAAATADSAGPHRLC